MARIRTQVTLPWTTNLPEDVTVNTFHFLTSTDPVAPADLVTINDNIAAFYNTELGAGATPLASFISALVSRAAGACRIEHFDIDDPEPRQPVGEAGFTLGAAANALILPPEVAMCMSYQADPVSGIPQARRRGRIYLGPLSTLANDAALGRPSAAFILQVAEQASGFLDLFTGNPVDWTIYSRVGDAMAAVTNGWVDNEWDTQRRRSLLPTSRTLWTILGP